MANSEKHQQGIEQFQRGDYDEALQLLSEALLENENCELWNDWATAQAARGQIDEAKKGYRRALQMNINDSQSAANLGVLLFNEGQISQAVPLLEKSLQGLDEQQRQAVQELLHRCKTPPVVVNQRATGS
jgi:Flp pilus assembly protein TadD